ncbi:MAG: ABC transporter permease [Armatimonadetes bacterium]|nr:ABC transporter permease [Anaerolineae bacterium]
MSLKALTRSTAVVRLPSISRRWLGIPVALIVAALIVWIGWRVSTLDHAAPLIADSTLNELALWMAAQSAAPDAAPSSLLGGLAWRSGMAGDAPALQTFMQRGVLAWCLLTAGMISIGVVGVWRAAAWARQALAIGLLGLCGLLLLIPVVPDDNTARLLLLSLLLLLAAIAFSRGTLRKSSGFIIAIALIFAVWEGGKALAASISYAIIAPLPAWDYTPYPTLDAALAALADGDIQAVFADENDLEVLMPPHPLDDAPGANPTYPDLRYLSRLPSQEQALIFPITPALPGRFSIAVRISSVNQIAQQADLIGRPVGAVVDDPAVAKFLALPRQAVLLDLQIFNDLNLPHLQAIAEAFLQPARRNGEFLLARILGEAGLYTWREALFGFGIGVIFGLLLGTLLAHVRLAERALLPYVVASQTVPILAIAPMVVIWLGASFVSVAVIAAYITFFPVAINTLRGLQAPAPAAVELMHAYAARWHVTLWKLRLPTALPYIFTALKVSATASVVGAVIGELPSGMGDGLGRAILDFSSDYSLVSTPKLWAAIITAALVGAVFFGAVSALERVVLRRYVRSG